MNQKSDVTVIRTQTDTDRLNLMMPVLTRRRLPGTFHLKQVSGGSYNLYSDKGSDQAMVVGIMVLPKGVTGDFIPVERLEAIRFPDLHQKGKMALDIHVRVSK